MPERLIGPGRPAEVLSTTAAHAGRHTTAVPVYVCYLDQITLDECWYTIDHSLNSTQVNMRPRIDLYGL